MNNSFENKFKNVIPEISHLLGYNTTDNEIIKQTTGAFLFGFINGLAQEFKESPASIQGYTIGFLVKELGYPESQAVTFSQDLINSTDPKHHRTTFSIIHRGLEGYFQYNDNDLQALKNNYDEVVKLITDAS